MLVKNDLLVENNNDIVDTIKKVVYRFSEKVITSSNGDLAAGEVEKVKYLVNNVLKDRFNYRKDVLVKEGFDESKTEFEIMDERGFPRLYDCGNKVYKLNLVDNN